MSMPHTCRCGICGATMSPWLVDVVQTNGSKPVEYSKAAHGVVTYTVVPTPNPSGAKP